MKNILRQGLAKKVILFAFLIGTVSPSAMAYVDAGNPTVLVKPALSVSKLLAVVAPVIQNLNVTTATGSASVTFSLNTNATTTVWIKDSNDTIVKTIAFDNSLSGSTPYTFTWNGTDNNNASVASGSYKAQVVTYNAVSSDIKSFVFNFVASGNTATAPAVSVVASPTSFDPSLSQSTTVTYTLNTPASLSVLVKLNGSVVRTLRAQSLQSAGTYNLSWSGLSDSDVIMGSNTYTVEVYANNASGSDTKVTTVAIASNTPVLTAPHLSSIYATPNPFDPNSQTTSIYFTLDKAATVNVNVQTGSTTRNLANGISLSSGTYAYTWNGRDPSGTMVANGFYTATVTASNAAGSDTQTTSIQVSTTTPVVSAPHLSSVYATPNPFNPNTQNTNVYFTLDKAATVNVNVQTGSTTRNLVNGTSLAAGTYYYQWNGLDSVGNLVTDGYYTATVTAANANGSDTQTASIQVSTGVSNNTCSLITSSYASPSSFDPSSTNAVIYYALSRNASVSARILYNGTSPVRTLLSSQSQNSGSQILSWNGRNDSGYVVSDSPYRYELTASVAGCSDDVETGYITVSSTSNGGGTGYVNDWASTDENLIQNVTVNNEVFRPRNGEQSTVNFDLTRSARLVVQVLDGTTVVKTLRDVNSQSSGTYSFSWDGRDTYGNIMRDAVYSFRIMANDGNNTDTDRASTELDTDGVIIGFPTDARCAGYVDVSINSPFCKAIQLMSTKQIFQGYSDGTFRPYASINRAETAKVVVLALGYDVNSTGYFGTQYNDTVAGAWYAPFLDVAQKNGIATGYPDGSFRPSNTINRVELLRVFLEANHLNLSDCDMQPFNDTPVDSTTQWYMKYACYAKNNGLMNSGNSNNLYPAKAMTRGDVANLFYDFDQKGLYSNFNVNGNGSGYNSNVNNNTCLSYNNNGTCSQYSNNNNQTCLSYDYNGNCSQYSNSNTNPINQVCVARNYAGTCTSWANDNTTCTQYSSNGSCLSYSTSGNSNYCTQYSTNGTCSSYSNGTNNSNASGNYCTAYNSNGVCTNYSNNSNGYYVYQNGRYVWTAY